eukprot:SAG11_NODE_1767_length_4282_cov_3.760220_4_plen_39_part_00
MAAVQILLENIYSDLLSKKKNSCRILLLKFSKPDQGVL